jgi:sarcosine oxidase
VARARDHDGIERAEVIVVGLGAMGSAATAQLAGRGVSVLGIDQFAPPHPHGSTHGDTRITRLAIGEGQEYVPLVRRSHELWREIERDTGRVLLTQPGFVVLAPGGSPFLNQTRAAALAYDIEHENLDASELARRFPMFAADDRTEAYHEPAGGYVRPEAAVSAQLALARRRGAHLRLGERVRRWAASPHGVLVSTDTDAYAADQLLLCAGAWIGELFPEQRERFAIYRQVMYWVAIGRGYEQLCEMPVFVWDFGGELRDFEHLDGIYGFPALDGPGGGLKVGTETYRHTSSPDAPWPDESAGPATDLVGRGLGARLPWLTGGVVRAVPCLYTCTRGSRFVIDRHPEHDAVTIVSACSGHGFKHSPAIGEAVAQWMTGSETTVDLAPFRLT